MKTECIKDIMELKFGAKEEYSKSDFDEITELTINRFDITREIIPVDFRELLYFHNIKSLTIKECIIDKHVMDIILNLNNLNNLYLDDCEVVDDISSFFENIKLDTLVINKINFDLSELEKVNVNNLYLYNINLNKDISFNIIKLDISNCIVEENININCVGIETLVIATEMYKNIDKELNDFKGHLIVMEDNGQYIKEERDV